ncbi:MAG TPA: hypothetical protein VG892_09690 [Terriglobales bacterium]|jgi:hypothetical protein|nr:hypothetical protein [Terriglobales bacterium]
MEENNTQEYVILVGLLDELQKQLNRHALLGYQVTHFTDAPQGEFAVVMARPLRRSGR